TDAAGNESDPLALAIVQAPSEESSVALEGLELWTRSGEGVTADPSGHVSRWADRSGHGNDLTQTVFAQRPKLARDAVSDADALRFDGGDDSLKLTTRLDGNIRAVFAVLKQNGDYSWRTLLGDTTKDDFNPGWMTWWGFASPFVLDGQTWVNAAAVDGTVTARPQTMSVLSVLPTGGVTADRLAQGKTNLPWIGDVAELLIYSEPRSGLQRKLVE